MCRRTSRPLGVIFLLLLVVALAKSADLKESNKPRFSLQVAPQEEIHVTAVPLPRLASVQDLLKLPEDKIDVGLYALTLAKEIYPDIDVAAYSAKIDALAEQVKRLSGASQDPDWRVRVLNTVIYREGQYHGSRDAVYSRNPDYMYLNRLLDTKHGNCLSMPILYVTVAQRLGWPVYPVQVPDHMFVRYVDPTFNWQNMETTSGGGWVPDEMYAKDFMVSEVGRRKGTYLRTMTYRELLGELVGLTAGGLRARGERRKAISYSEVATKLSPRNAEVWWNLGWAYEGEGKRASGKERAEWYAKSEEIEKRLKDMGWVAAWEIPMMNSQGEPGPPPAPPGIPDDKVKESYTTTLIRNASPSRPTGPILPDGTVLDPDLSRSARARDPLSRSPSWNPAMPGTPLDPVALQTANPGWLLGAGPSTPQIMPGGATPNSMSQSTLPRRAFGLGPISQPTIPGGAPASPGMSQIAQPWRPAQ